MISKNNISKLIMLFILLTSIETTFGSQVVVNYENKISPFTLIEKNTEQNFSGSDQTPGFRWQTGYIGVQKMIDASKETHLTLQLTNLSKDNLKINIEVKDSISTDYWSRANTTIVLTPGRSDIEIPLPLYVGDVSRRGRILNLEKIVSIILARSEPSFENKSILVHKIEFIKKETELPDGVFAFDFGTNDTPIFSSFKQVTESTFYRPDVGYGFIEPKFWMPYKLANDSMQPDSLYRDTLFLQNGEFQVDIPNGEYDIILNLDFSSGYWGEYPRFKSRKVWAQNKLVINHQPDRNYFADKYFYFSQTSDLGTENFFEKYYSKIFREHTFKVKVTTGKLQLKFEGDDCTLNPCFGMSLTSLIAAPPSIKKTQFLDKLKILRKKEFDQKFSFIRNTTNDIAQLSSNDFIVFNWPLMEELPEKIKKPLPLQQPLSLTSLISQKQSLSFGFISGTDQEIEIWVNNKKNYPQLSAWSVSRRLTRAEPASTSYLIAEKYLSDKKNIQLESNTSQRFWIEVDTTSVAAGLYETEIKYKVKNKTYTIPIVVNVLNFELPKIDFPVGPFNSTIQESWWYENDFRKLVLQKKSFETIAAHGMSTASFFADLEVDLSTQPVQLKNIENINHNMKLARDSGFLNLFAYNLFFNNADLCYGTFTKNQLKDIVGQLNSVSQKQKWLPLTIVICDEPVGDLWQKAIERTTFLQTLSNANIQFSTAFSDEIHIPESQKLLNLSNLPMLNLFSIKKLQQNKIPWLYYNSANRSSFGFGLAKLKKNTELRGRIAWNWNQNAGNPYFALDAREDDVNWCNSLRDGQLQCTVFLKRHIQEGLNDYRLLLLIENLSYKKLSDRQFAEKIINQIYASAEVSKPISYEKNSPNYTQEELWRNQILRFLEKISKETIVNPKSK